MSCRFRTLGTFDNPYSIYQPMIPTRFSLTSIFRLERKTMRQINALLLAACLYSSTVSAQTPATDPGGSMLPTRPTQKPATARPKQSPLPDSTFSPTTETKPRSGQPPVVLDEELTRFDDRMVELQWNGGRWQLWSGAQMLKDFGRHEADGRLALTVVREMHLTQHGTVGTPRAIMEYWLSDGGVPTESVPGLRTIPIDRNTLRIESVQGYWCVRDDKSTFFNFGTHKDEAERSLGIIKHHAFDRVGLIGQATPTMLVFLGTTPGNTAMPLHAPPPPRGRVMTAQGMQSVDHVFGELQRSTLQTSTFHPAPNPPGQPGLPNDPKNRPNTASGSDLAGAAMSFNRQLAPPSARTDLKTIAERVPLDFRQTRLSKDAEGWKLLCGNYVVGTFGPDENQAKLADMAFRTSRFTEQCVIGRPKPAFTYLLVNGKPPRELPLGAHGVSFRPDELSVRQVNGEWTISDFIGPLFQFGNREAEARETLKAIQHHRFDKYCRLGVGEQAMMILARTR
jgi:hypothetical protein